MLLLLTFKTIKKPASPARDLNWGTQNYQKLGMVYKFELKMHFEPQSLSLNKFVVNECMSNFSRDVELVSDKQI